MKNDPWIRGFAAACATAAKVLDGPIDAQVIVCEANLNREDLEKGGADPGDIETIWPADAEGASSRG